PDLEDTWTAAAVQAARGHEAGRVVGREYAVRVVLGLGSPRPLRRFQPLALRGNGGALERGPGQERAEVVEALAHGAGDGGSVLGQRPAHDQCPEVEPLRRPHAPYPITVRDPGPPSKPEAGSAAPEFAERTRITPRPGPSPPIRPGHAWRAG